MSQFDFGNIDPYVVDGVQLADFLNQWRNSLYTKHRGPVRPTYIVPGMSWVDDSGGPTSWLDKLYMSAGFGDATMATYNTTTGKVTLGAMSGTAPASIADATDRLPTTAWVQSAINAGIAAAVATLLPVGTIFDLPGKLTVAPAGWVLAMQGTIGNAASGGTIRANADCANLFAHMWTLTNAQAPVLPGGRGVSAAADFAANKTIGGLDYRGRTRVTSDDNGGTAAGIAAGWLHGSVGGAITNALVTANLPNHVHEMVGGNGVPQVGNTGRFVFGDGTAVSNVATVATQGAASSAFNIMQPSRAGTTIIKL